MAVRLHCGRVDYLMNEQSVAFDRPGKPSTPPPCPVLRRALAPFGIFSAETHEAVE